MGNNGRNNAYNNINNNDNNDKNDNNDNNDKNYDKNNKSNKNDKNDKNDKNGASYNDFKNFITSLGIKEQPDIWAVKWDEAQKQYRCVEHEVSYRRIYYRSKSISQSSGRCNRSH